MIKIPIFEKSILGIDFGSLNIKILETNVDKNNLKVFNFGVVSIINFKEIFSQTYILEEQLGKMLNDYIIETKSKTKEAIVSISASYLFSFNFLVPDIPEKSLPQVIKFEAQKQIPLSLDEIEIEYRYFPLELENENRKWIVYLVATPKNYINKTNSILSLSRLKMIDYSPEYFNFEPFFEKYTGTYAVLDLGHAYSLLVIIKNGKVIYGNKIKIRGYDYLNSISNLIKLSDEETLNFILKKGFQFLPEEKELQQLSNSFLDNIATLIPVEINKVENNFFVKIDKIYWTGSLTILPGFLENMLSKLSKYQQEILLPFDFIKDGKFNNLKQKSTIFIHCLGSILRKLK